MLRRFASVAVLACLAGACTPYIYAADEFNRDRKEFGRDIEDRAGVDICYYTGTTTPQDLLAMAEAECGRFGKTARYLHSDVLECSMATPLRARFACDAR